MSKLTDKPKILEGLTFCFIGALDTITRKEANALMVTHGGQIFANYAYQFFEDLENM